MVQLPSEEKENLLESRPLVSTLFILKLKMAQREESKFYSIDPFPNITLIIVIHSERIKELV